MMNYSFVREAKALLSEADVILRRRGVDPVVNHLQVLANDDLFSDYVSSLSEGLTESERQQFIMLSENVRTLLLQEAQFTNSWNPFRSLALPLLRIVFPRLVAKQATTVVPINAPEVVKYFLIPVVTLANGQQVELPNTAGTPLVSKIAPYPISVSVTPGTPVNLLQAANVTDASVDQPVVVVDATGNVTTPAGSTVSVTTELSNIQLDLVEPTRTINVTYVDPASGASATDTLLVSVDFKTGNVVVQSVNGATTSVTIQASVSPEYNKNLSIIELKQQKIALSVEESALGVKYSIELEQDLKALLDLDYQAEVVSTMGQAIANDIDRQIISDILSGVNLLAKDNIETFSRTVPTNYTFGPRLWYQNITTSIASLSQKIYGKTNIAEANVILAHPEDAAILEQLDSFKYVSDNGTGNGGALMMGYSEQRVGVLQNRWSVLVSPNVPRGKMIVALRPEEEKLACYIYAPYVPIIVYPYPLQDQPTITFKSRYAKKMIRPYAFGYIDIA